MSRHSSVQFSYCSYLNCRMEEDIASRFLSSSCPFPGCKKCPPRTRDAPGLFYKFWTRFPGEPVHLYCVARPSTGCKTPKGWQVHGDYMDTGLGHSDDAELLLVITVPEFTSIQNELNMDFAVDCPLDTCR